MTNGWDRLQLGLALSAVLVAACATPLVEPVDDPFTVPEGSGGSLGETPATGGTPGSMPAVGGTGDPGAGGTGGSSESGTGGSSADGSGGTNAAGAGNAMTGGGRSATGGRVGRGGSGMGTGAVAGTGSGMGCAKLSVPMNAATDKAHFVVSLRSDADLSAPGTTISLRVHVEDGKGGVILPYAQDSAFNFLGPATKPLLAEQSGWVTLEWDIGAEPAAMSGIMKRSISRIGIELKAAPSATWSNPTVVYVDAISVNTPALSFPFGTTGTVSATAQSSDVAGQVLWLNSGASDTTATGSKLSWVADCP